MIRFAFALLALSLIAGDGSAQQPENAPAKATNKEQPEPKRSEPQQAKPKQTRPKRRPRRARRAMQRHRPMSTAIHEAWLKEVLDLDMSGAIREYSNIKKQRKDRNQPERWLAVARLAELSRLGVIEPEPDSLPTKIPKEVQEALKELQEPFPIMDVKRDPVSKHPLPPLRPATRRVQDWVRNQVGPTVSERLRSLRDRSRSSGGRSYDPAMLRRLKANDILIHELSGYRTQAEAKRKLDFPNWKPPVVEGDPKAILAKLRERLQKWHETEESDWQRRRLERLKATLEEQAAIAPTNAIDFVRRLPIYAERLLLPPKDGDKPKTDSGKGPSTNGDKKR